jgi:hypothetical protein
VRALAAALVVGLALAAAPLASASLFPTVGLGGVHAVKLAPAKQTLHSCSVQSKSKAVYGRISRKVIPVACEQPPRSHVFDVGFAVILKP